MGYAFGKRFTVKVHTNGQIVNMFQTDSDSEAIQKESEYSEEYGFENVWIADAITEIMVG